MPKQAKKTKTTEPAAGLPRVEGLLSAATGEVINLPLQTREAELRAVDGENADGFLRAEMVWTTGAQVRRFDYREGRAYWEELSLDAKHVRMSRLQNGASLLFNHWAYGDFDSVLGTVESASVDGKRGVASVRFSARESLAELRQDVRDGIIKKVSHMYRIHAYEVVENGPEGLPIYRATDWEPLEISLVSIAADDAANVVSTKGRAGARSADDLFPCTVTRAATQEELHMPKEVKKGAAPAEAAKPDETRTAVAPAPAPEPAPVVTPPDAETLRQEATVAERRRATRIRTVGASVGMDGQEIQRHIDDGTSTADFEKTALDVQVTRSEEQPPTTHGARVQVGQDETETRREAAVGFLMHRGNRGKYKLPDAAQDLRRMNLMRMAETCLEWKGERHRNLSADEMIWRAMTGTDLPYIVEAAVSKVLLDGYQEHEPTFLPFCRRVDLPDFKLVNRIGLSEVPTLTKHKDGAETKRTELSDEKEQWSIDEYRNMLQITRQTIINDDMDAFSRIPVMFADAARRMESNVVWAVVTANAAMADGVALFHSGHSNYNSTPTAPSQAAMGAVREKMRKQKGRDGTTKIDVRPEFILAPVALEQTFEQLLSDVKVVLSSDRSEIKTASLSMLTLITEPRLDDTSVLDWYGAVSPSTIDTIEYGSLEGTSGPTITSQTNFDTGGLDLKVLEDFGAKSIDHRGLYKQKGV